MLNENTPKIEYRHSPQLAEFFQQNSLSLLVSSYQAQRVLLFSAKNEHTLRMLVRVLPKPMGICLSGKRLAIASKQSIWYFSGEQSIVGEDGNALPYDLTFVPRYSVVTGDILAHQIAFSGTHTIVVNTRFSCLAHVSTEASFVPFWKPSFIDVLAAEDRCHLNGLALLDGKPKYVTALGISNEKEGWRALKSHGGCVIDVDSSEILCQEISMPHSPLVYSGKLWLLESGKGLLITIDPKTGQKTEVCKFPGYTRGLSFYKHFAFVGLSKIREKQLFSDLPIQQNNEELECGISIVDLSNGSLVGTILFTKGVEELFDLSIIVGCPKAHLIGFEDDMIDGVFLVPKMQTK